MKIVTTLLFLGLLLMSTSCEKEDPEIPNEEEVITTLIYTLTPEGGGSALTMKFTDLDGDGGDAPELIADGLAANTTYTGALELLNEQENPAESITEEIEEEDEEHQFFFEGSSGTLDITYDDEDSEGNPVGLRTILKTGNAGTTTLTITLRHEPNKSASGVTDGDITNAGGETDIQVVFDVSVQ